MKKKVLLALVLALIFVGCAREEQEVYSYQGKTYSASELSRETREWLKYYNSLSEDEQKCISMVPPELIDSVPGTAVETNAASS